jgi:hypothetical protein
MIRATFLIYIALILVAPGASRALAEEPSPKLPPRIRLPRSISSHSVSMYARARFLVSEATRQEFKLSDAQADQTDDLLREWSAFEEESNRKPTSPRGQNPARNTRKISKTQKYLQRLQTLLTAEQNAHLNRLVLKARGLGVFITRDPIAARFELSDEQRKQVRAIYRDRSASKESRLARWLEILTPEQQKIWDEVAGKDFVMPDRAQRRGRVLSLEIPTIRSPAKSLRKAWVQRDLKVTVEQAAKIDALFATLEAERLAFDEQVIASGLREALQQEIDKLRKLTVETSKSLLAAISESQRKRLDQLILQIDGPFAFRRPDVQERLDLNLTQRASINRLMREYQSLFIGKRSEDKAKLLEEASRKRKQLMKDYLLLLTPEQLKKWEEVVGPKADQSLASETTR